LALFGYLCGLFSNLKGVNAMKITWNFADGTKSEVEVNEELGEFITASRREESNLDRKERYHC